MLSSGAKVGRMWTEGVAVKLKKLLLCGSIQDMRQTSAPYSPTQSAENNRGKKQESEKVKGQSAFRASIRNPKIRPCALPARVANVFCAKA